MSEQRGVNAEVERPPEPGVQRGRPGRRTAEDRTTAVVELLSGKASVDTLARGFGVTPETIEKWREEALAGLAEAMRRGAKSPRERELERELASLQKAFTDLAVRHELVNRALKDRPSKPGRSSR